MIIIGKAANLNPISKLVEIIKKRYKNLFFLEKNLLILKDGISISEIRR